MKRERGSAGRATGLTRDGRGVGAADGRAVAAERGGARCGAEGGGIAPREAR
eukprot:COSAG03_NODE_1774_length_3540_cov_3.660564_3_plen_52_part_00